MRERRSLLPSAGGLLNRHHAMKQFYIVLFKIFIVIIYWLACICCYTVSISPSIHRYHAAFKALQTQQSRAMTLLMCFFPISTLLRLILGIPLARPLRVVSSRPLNRPPGEQGSLLVASRYCALLPRTPGGKTWQWNKNAKRSAFNVMVLTMLEVVVGGLQNKNA